MHPPAKVHAYLLYLELLVLPVIEACNCKNDEHQQNDKDDDDDDPIPGGIRLQFLS